MSAAAIAAAAAQRRQRELVAAFAGAGAVDAAHARTPAQVGAPDHPRALQRLRDHGVLRMGATGCYWVDLGAWQARRRRARRFALAMALLAIVVATLVAVMPALLLRR